MEGSDPQRDRSAAPFRRSKAAWLSHLRNRATQCVVDDFLVFTSQEWSTQRSSVIARVTDHFDCDTPLIVRSSAFGEDGSNESFAGAFRSVVVMGANRIEALCAAVDRVVDSYGIPGRTIAPADEVIVQRHVSGVLLSGVVLTRDVWQGLPYYVVDYDDLSGLTHTVTSGLPTKTCRFPKGVPIDGRSPPMWHALLRAIREVERAFSLPTLNIEFAITPDGVVHVFQVRELTRLNNIRSESASALRLVGCMTSLRGRLAELLDVSSDLPGASTVLADMSDWNPAEILGAAPRPLDVSLYRNLVTASAYNRARRSLGYTDVRNHELMLLLGCKPYIDVRVSLNSLAPALFSDRIRELIVNCGVERLRAEPQLQDKLEFEIALSSMDFGTETRIQTLVNGGLPRGSVSRVIDVLRQITNAMVEAGASRLSCDLASVKMLESGSGRLVECRDAGDLPSYIRTALSACTEFGTIPFSRAARLAFVALALLRSGRSAGVISEDQYSSLFMSLSTVAADVALALTQLAGGGLSYAKFINRFGHLRPRMYDIRSLPYSRYGIDFWRNARGRTTDHTSQPEPKRVLGDACAREFRRMGLRFGTDIFVEFAVRALETRERIKFRFSRCVSGLLETLAAVGEGLGLSREELSFLSVEDLLFVPTGADARTVERRLIDAIAAGRETWQKHAVACMPSLAADDRDLLHVSSHRAVPTFVTRERVHAPVLDLASRISAAPVTLDGRIVVLEAADPGFDWIFAFRPAGLVTRYGGAGSHMAIRCGEFAVPAAIGCGENLFHRVKTSRWVVLDCAASQIELPDTPSEPVP